MVVALVVIVAMDFLLYSAIDLLQYEVSLRLKVS